MALKVGLSKSSISRILSGSQEPKLLLAYDLAKALGVTLDYLVDDSPEVSPTDQLVMITEEEMTILRIVRHLGPRDSIDRLLKVGTSPIPGVEGLSAAPEVPPRRWTDPGKGDGGRS